MKSQLNILGFILIILAVLVTFFSPSTIPISPLSMPISKIQTIDTDVQEYVVLGFAPYWNLKKLIPNSLESITHFAYFHLLLNSNGSIYTNDPGYTNYKRLIEGAIDHGNKPLIITFMPESQTALSSSISSKTNRQKTINTIIQTLNDSNALGANIDYEPLDSTSPALRENFTLFIQELNNQLSRLDESNKLLTISIYASAATNPRLWDLKNLSKYTNYFVVMTYDYTMPDSNSAGPNSPLRGSGGLFEHDVIKNIAEIAAQVPSQKILLGIPFYGYEWDTADSSKYAIAQDRGSVASLERIQKMLDDKTLELIWDRNTLTPYGVASISGQTSQIYFENETSIRLKLEFVKSANLGGIAIWALGYEGKNTWIWPTIRSLNQ